MASGAHPKQQKEASDAKTEIDHICALDIYSDAAVIGLCGIICTIGPASREPAVLMEMFDAGMTVARLNFSHGSHEYHAETIKNVRTAVANYSKKIGRQFILAIALDTKGPEIRTGLLEGGGSAEVELKKGDTIKLTTDKAYAEKGNNKVVYVDYDNIVKVVKVDNHIFIDDGLISLKCVSVKGNEITCIVENGGKLGSKKGVNLPNVPVDLPAVSAKDKSDLVFGVEQGVDMIFASFIRNAAALSEIRQVLGPKGAQILVISKIENHQGIQNIDEIIEASDGIMIARGDMGIEIPTEKVFIAQKSIIARCNKIGKPVVCATQMLESMTYKPRPTRAESSDVANAILDGADCVMLSGETAKGEYPVICVQTMENICREAEAAVFQKRMFLDLCSNLTLPVEVDHCIAIAAVEASIKALANGITVVSTSDRCGHLVSKYKPRCPIIAVTASPQVARQARLWRAVFPLLYEVATTNDFVKDTNARVDASIAFGKQQKFFTAGDSVIVVTDWHQGSGVISSLRVMTV